MTREEIKEILRKLLQHEITLQEAVELLKGKDEQASAQDSGSSGPPTGGDPKPGSGNP